MTPPKKKPKWVVVMDAPPDFIQHAAHKIFHPDGTVEVVYEWADGKPVNPENWTSLK